jgi:transglycosylase-like protein with SLT domain
MPARQTTDFYPGTLSRPSRRHKMAPAPKALCRARFRAAACGLLRLALAATALALNLVQALPARAEPQGAAEPGAVAPPANSAPNPKPRPSADKICRVLTQAAAENGLPIEFFTRLIWQESRFNPDAVSPKGALGIAQFMPRTASDRGLADPLEPLTALRESAGYLRELRTTFRGNLGLAAAAYNAGPGRVEAWLAGRRGLPEETRTYVLIVTGHHADAWASEQQPQWQASGDPLKVDCAELAKLITASLRARPALTSSAAWGPWGVQLTANWSEGPALAAYERLRRTYEAVLRDRLPLILHAHLPGRRGATKYIVRVSEKSRASADSLCARLRAAGGACIVLRNPSR